MSITNERGTKQITLVSSLKGAGIIGTYIGHCVLGNYLTVFTHSLEGDYIFRIQKESEEVYNIKCLTGDKYGEDGVTVVGFKPLQLNFDVQHPLQTLGVYENKFIQKVYWTDGINQPRFINIVKDSLQSVVQYDESSFDFVPKMQLQDSISVRKIADSSASFGAGVIQYFVSYYNKYGQETNISCASPLIPTSFSTRAGNAEEKIGNAFEVTIDKPDNTFEYVRIYSIFRSSLDATPSAKRVADIRLGYGGASANTKSLILKNIEAASYKSRWTQSFSICVDNSFDFQDGESFKESENTLVPGVNITSKFSVFKKSDYPNLYLSALFYINGKGHNYSQKYITWGNATTLYVSPNSKCTDDKGHTYSGYSIFGANESGLADFTFADGQILTNSSKDKVTFVDNGTVGDDMDVQELLYIGGESITAETIEQKDGTMFFGNIKVNRPQISENFKEALKIGAKGVNGDDWSFYRYAYLPKTMQGDSYSWQNSLNAKLSSNGKYDGSGSYEETNPNTSTAGFKSREHYRLGVQFQYETGKWSEPIWLGDKTENNVPSIEEYTNASGESVNRLKIPSFAATIDASSCQTLIDAGYVRARAIIVQPEARDRLVIAQGILAPTVYSIGARENHAPDFQSSWFFRPWGDQLSSSSSSKNTSSAAEIQQLSGSVTLKVQGQGNVSGRVSGKTYGLIKDDNTCNLTFTSLTINTGDSAGTIKDGTFIGHKHDYSGYWEGSITGDVEIYDTSGAFITTISGEILSGTLTSGSLSYDTIDSGIINSGSTNGNGEDSYIDHVIQNKNDFTLYSTTAGSEIQGLQTLEGPKGNVLANTLKIDEEEKSKYTNLFCVDQQNVTMHSPEFEWNDSIASLDWATVQLRKAGYVVQTYTTGDIDVQVETPQIGEDSVGFIHCTVRTQRKGARLCDGLFWQDEIVQKKNSEYSSTKDVTFIIYPWQRSGSLNNDQTRAEGKGTRTAILKRKIISNLLFFNTSYFRSDKVSPLALAGAETKDALAYFNSDTLTVVKPAGENYYGNVDSLLAPYKAYYFVGSLGTTSYGIRRFLTSDTEDIVSNPIETSRESVRMKYKSTPHIAICLDYPLTQADTEASLYIGELYREALPDTDFGGTTEEALESNLWIPAGDPIELHSEGTTIYYDYGDTWYQRYDCLKTYSYTDEDLNSVVEIGSFMVETHINIDGRYDRNRGQDSNLTMSPTNFNLINEVYSQKDNFFNYRILDSDYYSLREFPSMITWSTAKNNASDVDAWTTVTLASTLEIDGTKGQVTAVVASKDLLYAFQDRGITQIMFNSRVAISTSDNVPIEISNNYKVDGDRYISTAVGCSNKFAIAKATQGVYFIDDIGNVLYLLNGDQLTNITDTHGMGYWLSQQDTESAWLPMVWNEEEEVWKGGSGMSLYYDFNEKDLYVSTADEILCYSELLNQFVSFMNYQGGVLFNIGSSFYGLTNNGSEKIDFWYMFNGIYNEYFYDKYQSDITFISNAENTLDKIFTNLEIRADFRNADDEIQHEKFFDTIRVWDEYQDTQETALTYKSYPYSESPISSNLKKKFRIWRCEIPRAAKAIVTQDEDGNDVTSYKRTLDRIRNTWCKIKLSMNIDKEKEPLVMEVHDVQTVYYT